jgi:MYXO-CTERM domain-containing protein
MLSLESGETAGITLVFKNTGTATWTPGRTRLGTVGPRDRDSALMADGWIASNRPAAVQAETKPGELGVFTFAVTAPPVDAPRAYSEDFGLVEEGVTWFGPEMGIAVELEVAPASGPLQSGTMPMAQGGCTVGGARALPGPMVLALLVLVVFFARRRVSS